MAPLLIPLIAEAIGAGLAGTVIVGTLTVGSLLASVLVAGAATGALLLMHRARNAQPTFKGPPAAVTFEMQAIPVSDRFTLRGRNRDAGQMVFRETDGVTLGYIRVISCRKITLVAAFFVDDELLPLSTGPTMHNRITPLGTYTVEVFDEGGTSQWPNAGIKHVAFFIYIYDRGQPIPVIVGYGPAGYVEFANATAAGHTSKLISDYFPSLWGAPHKLCGLTQVASIWGARGTTNRPTTYPRLYPNHNEVTLGCPIWNPRDPAQSFLHPDTGLWSDENPTWAYSANPPLHMLDVLTTPREHGGGGIDLDLIDLDSFRLAADRCDRLVEGFGGAFKPFAEFHAKIMYGEELRDTIAKIEASCDGQVFVRPNGRIGMRILEFAEPTVTLDERAIGPFQLDTLAGIHSEVNLVQGTYAEPRLNFVKNAVAEARFEASIAEIGAIIKPVDFEHVQDPDQCFRLSTRVLRRANPPTRLRFQGGPRCLSALDQWLVRITLPNYGIDGVYQLVEPVESPDRANYSFMAHEITAAMFEDVIAPNDPISPSLPNVISYGGGTPLTPNAPLCVVVVVVTSPLAVRITASITAPPAMVRPGPWSEGQYSDTQSIAHFRWREVGTADWILWNVADQIGQYTAQSPLTLDPTPGSLTYEIEAWLVSPTNQPGGFSTATVITF